MFTALAEFAAMFEDDCKAQCARHQLPKDHPNYQASRKRANQEWAQMLASATDRGIVAHPKRSWDEGEVTFTIAKAPHPLRFAHFAKAAEPGYAASTQYHLIEGSSPDYEALASSVWPDEQRKLSAIATDRRYWLCDAMPNQVKASDYRVGSSEFYVVPIWDPRDGEAKVVACDTWQRPRHGMGFWPYWVLPLGAVNADVIQVALDDAMDPTGDKSGRLIKAPWDLISLAERHAFAWASQWAERLDLDDEHSFGAPPGDTVEAPGPKKFTKKQVSRTAYERFEADQLARSPKPYRALGPSGIDPWRDRDPDWEPPSRRVRVVRTDPAALAAACDSADREQAIRALMGDTPSAESDRAAFYQGWSRGPDEQW